MLIRSFGLPPAMAALLLAVACSSGGNGTTPTPTPAPPHVITGGTLSGIAYNEPLATTWVDGAAVTLGVPATLTGLAASGTQVYATGSDYNLPEWGVLWQNGLPTPLAGAAPGNLIDLQAIALSGGDVYLAGQDDYNGVHGCATYWKNGTRVPVGDGANRSALVAICVQGADVYTAGTDGNDACTWKNTTRTLLGANLGTTLPAALAVAPDGKVLVAGAVAPGTGFWEAALWQDGVPTLLPTTSLKGSRATAMALSGTDVYVAGMVSNGTVDIATLWKNGVATALSDGTSEAEVWAMALDGTDVYVAGSLAGTATYWKNGTAVPLAGGQDAVLAAICILRP